MVVADVVVNSLVPLVVIWYACVVGGMETDMMARMWWWWCECCSGINGDGYGGECDMNVVMAVDMAILICDDGGGCSRGGYGGIDSGGVEVGAGVATAGVGVFLIYAGNVDEC